MNAPQQFGRYQVISLLGEGGMGQVWLAKDPNLARKVALKVIRRELAKGESLRRFQAESLAAARSHSTHIVEIYDLDQLSDGTPFLVMEFVNGPRLQDIIEQIKRPSQEFIASVLLQMVLGLQSAAEKRIVHRDIKPANILFNTKGVAKISDFGVARFENQDITRPRQLLGTVAYMSPEQIQNAAAVGPEADLFSVGVIGYLLLAGRLPFQGRDVETVLSAICEEEPTDFSETRGGIYPELKSIVLSLLQKNSGLRPSHESVTQSLRSLLVSVGILDLHQPVQATLDTLFAKHSSATTMIESIPRTAKTKLIYTQRTDTPGPEANSPKPISFNLSIPITVMLLVSLAIALYWGMSGNQTAIKPLRVPDKVHTVVNDAPIFSPVETKQVAETTQIINHPTKTKDSARVKQPKQTYRMTVYPLHAELTIDGVRHGASPVLGKWTPGPHHLEAYSAMGQWDTVVQFPPHQKAIEIVLTKN